MPNITFLFNLLIIIEEETEQAHIAHFVSFAGAVVVVCELKIVFATHFVSFAVLDLDFVLEKRNMEQY